MKNTTDNKSLLEEIREESSFWLSKEEENLRSKKREESECREKENY